MQPPTQVNHTTPPHPVVTPEVVIPIPPAYTSPQKITFQLLTTLPNPILKDKNYDPRLAEYLTPSDFMNKTATIEQVGKLGYNGAMFCWISLVTLIGMIGLIVLADITGYYWLYIKIFILIIQWLGQGVPK